MHLPAPNSYIFEIKTLLLLLFCCLKFKLCKLNFHFIEQTTSKIIIFQIKLKPYENQIEIRETHTIFTVHTLPKCKAKLMLWTNRCGKYGCNHTDAWYTFVPPIRFSANQLSIAIKTTNQMKKCWKCFFFVLGNFVREIRESMESYWIAFGRLIIFIHSCERLIALNRFLSNSDSDILRLDWNSKNLGFRWWFFWTYVMRNQITCCIHGKTLNTPKMMFHTSLQQHQCRWSQCCRTYHFSYFETQIAASFYSSQRRLLQLVSFLNY